MECNKCAKELNEEEILHFDSLAPMTGYNYIPDGQRCIVCKKPVCKECMYGLGMFMFCCKQDCREKIERRLNGK